MSPNWMTTLVRARRSQAELANRQLASARRADQAAQRQVHRAHHHLDELQSAEFDGEPAAFVAAMVALQSAAATHAAALTVARSAESETTRRRRGVETAATAQLSAEELLDRATRADAAHEARRNQHEMDEAGAAVHRRQGLSETDR